MRIVNFILDNRGSEIEYTSDREDIINEIEYHFTTNKLLEIKLEDRTILLNLRNVILTEIVEAE